jgi:CheY-like chemotaxis protein
MSLQLLELKTRRPNLFAGDNERYAGGSAVCQAMSGIVAMPDLPLPLKTKEPRKTLLLVSDDADLGVSLGHTASHVNLAFYRVPNSAQALRLTVGHSPVIIFVDLDLPELEGWKAAERFLSDKNGPPLVLLTGRATHFDLDLAICAELVLDKSVHPSELTGKVNRLLAKLESEQEHRRAGQRLLIRWLRPYGLDEPVSSLNRLWGINE